MSFGDFMWGSEGEFVRESQLTPEQQEIWRKYKEAADSGFMDAANYYKSILADDPELYNQLFASELQRFERETMPDLAEQYAGLGSGGINSSGFQLAASGAGADLAERLAGMRANLKGQAATGMSQMAQGLLTPTDYVAYQQPQSGFAEKALGTGMDAAATYYTGGMNKLGQQAAKSIYKG
ncbi:MAG: hypothetical protein PQJ44_06920 [Sphaerochaetaceae bacterium]|nr:hypothetical protein [Sphaerochaetaceae bacterium]